MQAAIKKPIEPIKQSTTPAETPPVSPFWSLSADVLLGQLHSSLQGLTADEAGRRLEANAGHRLDGRQQTPPFVLLLSQFKSPIILLLVFAAGLSMFLRRAYRSPDYLFNRVRQRAVGLLAGAWRGQCCGKTAGRRADKSERSPGRETAGNHAGQHRSRRYCFTQRGRCHSR